MTGLVSQPHRLRCPYCNHDPLKHEIKDASLTVLCSDCLGGICGDDRGGT